MKNTLIITFLLISTIAFSQTKKRVAYLKKFPYGIHYISEENTITIVALFHTAENPQKWNKR